MGDPAGVVLLLLHQAYIALLEIGEVIENDELYLVVENGFQFKFDLADMVLCITCSELCQFLPVTVEIRIELIETVIGPEEILVLYPVLTKRQLRPIVELRLHRA